MSISEFLHKFGLFRGSELLRAIENQFRWEYRRSGRRGLTSVTLRTLKGTDITIECVKDLKRSFDGFVITNMPAEGQCIHVDWTREPLVENQNTRFPPITDEQIERLSGR